MHAPSRLPESESKGEGLMTRVTRIVGILLALAGATYAVVSAFILTRIPWGAAMLEDAKEHAHGDLRNLDVVEWKTGATFNSELYLLVGLAATICGIAIAMRRRWGRILWLSLSVLVVLFYIYAGISGNLWWHYLDLIAFAATSLFLARQAPKGSRVSQ